MNIATITFRLHAPWVHSLKEKRMIVKSIIASIICVSVKMNRDLWEVLE